MPRVPMPPSPPHDEEFPFYAVSLPKFALMSIVTFSIFDFYWAYKNWQRIKARTSEQLSPFWRAWFGLLWSFSLFNRIRDQARQRGVQVPWSPSWLGAAYLTLSIAWRFPSPWGLVGFLFFVPILPVVQTINALHDQGGYREPIDSRYSVINGAIIAIGGLLVLAAIAADFLPDPTL
jgi:hypothetical protein